MNTLNVYQREYKDLKTEIDTKVQAVCSSGRYILGKEVEDFEKTFAQYLGVKEVIGVGNGMEALEIGMMALGIGKGDEVITTSLSAVATTLAITSLGATPVFVDIDDYFHTDAERIEKSITKKTKAILPVHLYGQAVDMEKINSIAKTYGLFVFEDACQGHGATYKKKKLGTFGVFGAFSFYPTKNLGCYGDGGAIATDDEKFADMCRSLRNYGQKDRYVHQYCGLNSRLDEMQAGILRVKLPYLDAWSDKRSLIAKQYASLLEGVGDVQIPEERPNAKHIYHQYVVRTQKRDALLSYLQDHGIQALIHYPIPIHKQPCYEHYNAVTLPVTEKSCHEIMSLPIHPYMTEDEIVHVTEIIKTFFGSL